MIDALTALHGAPAILGMLPEHPGYNGAVLLIDDEEAARCVAEIDAAAAELSALRAERDAAIAENNEVWAERNALRAERDAHAKLLNSCKLAMEASMRIYGNAGTNWTHMIAAIDAAPKVPHD